MARVSAVPRKAVTSPPHLPIQGPGIAPGSPSRRKDVDPDNTPPPIHVLLSPFH
ncbi:hypothetical protein BDV98DRAFT_575809 [Pterulicium gracile]|uniref:Uncharacterized protein n=1 Tax=Pterulicium gracile TaxID=1884261 RepID=A0A5C3Q515_9AGAR|nr:hypothetical protein BDV98DRAFT_575809 [Pterula gracilis]